MPNLKGCLVTSDALLAGSSSLDQSQQEQNKRKRFNEDQLKALTDLAEKHAWALPSLSKEDRDKFCEQYNITRVGHHALFPCQLAPVPVDALSRVSWVTAGIRGSKS